MSTNTRQFYCHECRAQMTPLMHPEPICSRCNSAFVEEIDPEDANPEHDPRNFVAEDDEDGPFGHNHFGGDPLIGLMNALMGSITAQQDQRRQESSNQGTPLGGASPPGTGTDTGRTIRFVSGPGRSTMMFSSSTSNSSSPQNGLGFGGGGLTAMDLLFPSLTPPGRERSPNMFGADSPTRGSGSPGARQGPPLGTLLSLLLGGRPPGSSGQMGDYVLDQQALDEVITRLMDASQGSRPNPAPEDMIEKLPRTKITADSPLIDHDCAVCKDTFTTETTEDIITLPCNDNPKYRHSFHEDCIVPWLKQNGTCPVCRFQLVPQPEPHGTTPQSPNGGPGTTGAGAPGGLFNLLFGGGNPSMGGGNNSTNNNNDTSNNNTSNNPSAGTGYTFGGNSSSTTSNPPPHPAPNPPPIVPSESRPPVAPADNRHESSNADSSRTQTFAGISGVAHQLRNFISRHRNAR